MTLAEASWLPKAKELRLGERRRTDHDCGPGRTLIVEHNDDGYRGHCFRCNDRDWRPPEPVPLAVRLERLRQSQMADRAAALAVTGPEPRVYDWALWPDAAKLWLLKAGIGSVENAALGAWYHPPSNRVVLPVYSAGRLAFWQARSIDGRQPKYLAPDVDRGAVLPQYGKAASVTLTEDILSAFKVGLVAEGWSLMGTSMNSATFAALVKRGAPVNVWLDPDAAGQRAAKKVLLALRGAGLTARSIRSEKDPKLLHREQINQLIGAS